MFCPDCGAEYKRNVSECADCGVALVHQLPPEPEHPDEIHLVTVLEAKDAGEVALAKSLLADAQIPYLARNEHLQDLFGLGRLVGHNPITGPVLIQVSAEHAPAALELLAHFTDTD